MDRSHPNANDIPNVNAFPNANAIAWERPLPERFALVNGRIVLPQRIEIGPALVVERGKIAGLSQPGDLGHDLLQLDAGGRLISPGLIDIHIHGALGHTFNEASDIAFASILRQNARSGVTALLATTATDSLEHLLASLAMMRRWMHSEHAGAYLLGAHVEGPYFNPAQCGAQDPAQLRLPDDGTTEQLLTCRDVIRIFTFAPELPGALALTRRLVQLGIVPAAGHSAATEEEVMPVIEAGLRHMIHLWSAQSSTIRQGPWRKPGLLEVSLTDARVSGEIIADGKHLPPTLIRLAYKCLGADRLCVVSDATSGAGLADGSTFRMGGMTYEVDDGVGMLRDRGAFAGSTTLLNQMLPVLVHRAGIPVTEAIRMASLTPAGVIGVEQSKGSLERDKDADIAIFADDFSAWRTIIGGRRV